MKVLAKLLIVMLCFTGLSCSSLSVLFIRNESSSTVDYRIVGITYRDREKPLKAEGTLAPGEVHEALTYFSDSFKSLKIETAKQGTPIYAGTLTDKQLPDGLRRGSSGGLWNHVAVTESGIRFGVGKGDWLEDFQHRFGMMWVPCCGCVGLVGIFGFFAWVSRLATIRREIDNRSAGS